MTLTFFQKKFRKPMPEVFDPEAPLPSAFAVTLELSVEALGQSLADASEASLLFRHGEFNKAAGILLLAQQRAKRAVALMEAASILHDQSLSK